MALFRAVFDVHPMLSLHESTDIGSTVHRVQHKNTRMLSEMKDVHNTTADGLQSAYRLGGI